MKIIFLTIIFFSTLFADYYSDGLVEYNNGNDKKALELFRQSCEKGKVGSCYLIGIKFYTGKTLKKDYGYAKEFFEKSCNNSVSNACYNVGFIHLNGLLGKRNYVKALDFFKIACDKFNYRKACVNVSGLYFNGYGKVKKDNKKFANYLGKACENNNYKSCSQLGFILYKGKIIKKDYPKAFRYFDKGCENANINESCLMKGYFYLAGYGIEKNYLEAETIFKTLCDDNYKSACKALKDFYKKIDIKTNKEYLELKQKLLEKQKEKNYVIDIKTNLMWQDDIASKTEKRNFKGAVKYCKELKMGEYDDWRLPNGSELISLLDKKSKTNTISIIKNAGLGTYWSSSIRTKDDTAWCIKFEYLLHMIIPLDNPQNIRCVRGKELPLNTLKFMTRLKRIN